MARVAFVLLAAIVAACGGTQRDSDTPEPSSEKPEELDQQFAGYADIEVQSRQPLPVALGRPGMTRVTPRRPVNLVRQRRVVAQKGRSEVDVQILATLLWVEADAHACCVVCPADQRPCGARCIAAGGECKAHGGCACTEAEAGPKREQEAALRNEALEALRGERERLGGETGRVTLEMLASAEFWAGNRATAAGVYGEILERFPDHEGAAAFRSWLAYLKLGEGKTAEAAAITAGWQLEGQSHLGAYVMAWVNLRQGQVEPARAAMAHAARNWKGGIGDALLAEILYFLVHTDTPVAEADALFSDLASDNLAARYAWMFQLSERFTAAGRFQAATDALDHIIDVVMASAEVPPDDLVGFRFRQADYQFRRNDPDRAAALGIDSVKALDECPANRCPAEVRERVVGRLGKLAVFYHTTYHATLDDRYFEPARQIYEFLVGLELPDAEQTRTNLTNLQDTRTRANPRDGKHDEKLLYDMVISRREVAVACYERALLGDARTEGAVRLSLEISREGEVAAASSEPAAGESGLAMVAACLLDRAQAWTFPGRSAPGKTTVVLPFRFQLAN